MKSQTLRVCLIVAALGSFGFAAAAASRSHIGAGPASSSPVSPYRVLEPIRHTNLEIFPVVSSVTHDTSQFLTLDEGVGSGEVVVTEMGNVPRMIRRRGGRWPTLAPGGGPQVNRLALINNSQRPLLLLAGEIVTGGKQDRIVGQDRIVPPDSDPIALDVFCVEPGRWVASSTDFSSMKSAMAAPAVRAGAMGDRNQQEVWSQAAKVREGIATGIGGGVAPATAEQLQSTTSYAKVMGNPAIADRVDQVAAPIEESYRSLIGELRERHAVGVVVVVNGRLVWADLFASTALFEKYWPKLVRSYAAEAISAVAMNVPRIGRSAAQAFLDHTQGNRESVEIEPGLFRRTEITGNGFKVIDLTSLLPETNFVVHIAKMANDNDSQPGYPKPEF